MSLLLRTLLVITSLGLYWMYNVNVDLRDKLHKAEAYQFEANQECRCEP